MTPFYLQVRCSSCGEFIHFRERVKDRGDLVKKVGININLKCRQCNKAMGYHVNSVRARPYKTIMLISSAFFFVMTGFLVYIFILRSSPSVGSMLFVKSTGLLLGPLAIHSKITSVIGKCVIRFNGRIYG